MALQALGDRVIIRPSQPLERTHNGVIVPDSAQRETQVGAEVVAVGPRADPQIKVGARVMHSRYHAHEIRESMLGELHVVLAADSVWALVED